MAPPEPENQATLRRRSSILHGPQARFPGAGRWGGGGGRLRIPRLLETRLRPSQRVSGFEACATAGPLRMPRLLETRLRPSQRVSGFDHCAVARSLRIPRLLEDRPRPSHSVSGFEHCAAAGPLRIPRLLEHRTRLSRGVSGPGKSGRSSMGSRLVCPSAGFKSEDTHRIRAVGWAFQSPY